MAAKTAAKTKTKVSGKQAPGKRPPEKPKTAARPVPAAGKSAASAAKPAAAAAAAKSAAARGDFAQRGIAAFYGEILIELVAAEDLVSGVFIVARQAGSTGVAIGSGLADGSADVEAGFSIFRLCERSR